MRCKRIIQVMTAVMVLSAGLCVSGVRTDAEEIEDEFSVPDENGIEALTDKNFEYIVNADLQTVTVTGYNGIETGQLVIPETLDGKAVTKIGLNAFFGKKGFTGIIFPAGLQEIETGAFSGCTGLTGTLVIPDTVTKIESLAFFGCDKLTGLILSKNLTYIGISCFEGCDRVSGELTIPASVDTFGDLAFKDFGKANDCTLILTEGLKTIGNKSFKGSGFTGELIIPSSVSSIGYGAFTECRYFTKLTIRAGVADIGAEAFKYCNFKGDLILPDTVRTLGDSAFYACNGFDKTLSIPSGLKTAGTESLFGLFGIQYINNQSLFAFDAGFFINDDTFFVRTGTEEKIDKSGKIGTGSYERALSAPSVSKISMEGDHITVKCKGVSGATAYVFERRVNGGKWKKISEQPQITFEDKKATGNGKKYSYRVYAYKDIAGTRIKSAVSDVEYTYYVRSSVIKSLTNKSASAMTVKWQKNGKCSGYQIDYCLNSKFKKAARVNIGNKDKTSRTIKKLTKRKHYFVRMRSYKIADGKKYYSAWSDTCKVKIKK